MNLAPVEQYFADYLSVLETREWVGTKYKCGSLINPKDLLHSSTALDLLRKELGLDSHETVWEYFLQNGISIPPNLIVAGTVNMDETTHGFSRKVIDRAFTIDFGDFFPNKFTSYFTQDANFKSLTFARYSSVSKADLSNVKADPTGELSIKFLSELNQTLITTPFEIAYRALNELLVALVCFLPEDNKELVAVWDDFLMTKILPRIEGDAEKLHLKDGNSLLTDLSEKIQTSFLISSDQNLRPDLLRTSISGDVFEVEFRSRKKIAWMEQRLIEHSFTSFWP
jgi:5-methylcytosine-specific restriction endonuclease McrBC GTP-binding regulatory subunit McrB